MFRKSIVAVATTALILGGTTATANAQSAAPYPSSLVPVHPGIVQTVHNLTHLPSDQIHAGLQIAASWAAWNFGSAVLHGGSSL
ncbi:hypothetical protein [Corynebacterium nasicanis]|uniref:Uncharacterized protein n=1 Tax=Corynebacterium nasicanis TaxID=1448267 RepID=A0ABW1QB12_9CORY